MISLAQAGLADPNSHGNLRRSLTALAAEGFMSDAEVSDALLKAWDSGVTHYLEDGLLTADEENVLASFKTTLALDQALLDRNGTLSKVVKAGVIRDLTEGKIPSRVTYDGGLPFNLQKSEALLWVFARADYLEDRTRRSYVGGYSGASIRIAKGVYWRVGGFRGHPVERTERIHVDTGVLGVTNKHVYFVGPKKSLRIRHDKVISLIPFDDGVGLHRDAQTAKPQIFVTGDGWFSYNLLANAQTATIAGA